MGWPLKCFVKSDLCVRLMLAEYSLLGLLKSLVHVMLGIMALSFKLRLRLCLAGEAAYKIYLIGKRS